MSTVHYQSCNLQNKVILVYIWATRPFKRDPYLRLTAAGDPVTVTGFILVRRL